ncbi:MFS transporter [Streptomyces sp. NPDC053493]|uniref:MFS transporter n=1 Tax=Streptomyces sp. NPDC053493 TaxID=3365705 RepID=UPI0037D01E11
MTAMPRSEPPTSPSADPSIPPTPSTPSASSPPATPSAPSSGRLWAVVLVACAGQFLVVLDVSVVNVALPSMRTDLGLTASGLQWVVNAYSIAFAGFMLLGGRAGDLFGRKRMFVLGLALFTAASVAGGVAQEGWQLLAARAVQGLGAAVLSPSTLTLLTAAVPEGPARTRAVGTWTAVGAAGGAAGGFVGGVLVDLLSWRWVLLINVPIGVLVLAGALFWLGETQGRAGGGRRLDLPGAVLVTAGLATLAYGIGQTEESGWTSAATLLPLTAGVLLLLAFVLVEARSPAPLMPLRIFRTRAVSAANATMALCASTTFGSWFFMTVYAQNVLGYTPLQAGLALVPSSVSVIAGSKLAPRLLPRFGPRTVAVTGTLVAAGGFAWQSTMTADGTYLTSILVPGVLMMFGIGVASTPLAILATTQAPASEAGLASGLINTSRTMGGALGLAVLSTVAASTLSGATTPPALTAGYAAAFRVAMCVLLATAALMTLWLPARRARSAC